MLIDRDYKMHISHNKIHKFLLDEFVYWYDCIKPHESLAPNGLKTSEKVFWERLQKRRI